MFYANINTKYFFGTSNILFILFINSICVFLSFFYYFLFSSYSQVPLSCMRRLGVKNLIPLDLEIEETLRKIRKDKRATTQTKQQPMDNMDVFREEEISFRMGDDVTPDTAQLDNVLRPIRDYARPLSTTQPMIRRPSIQANNFELKSITLQLLQGV